MGLADVHIHSNYSYDGICSIAAILNHVAEHTNLDVIAITDHDTMHGVDEALRLAPQYGVRVIPGCEVSTAEGHLLTLFVDRPVSAGLSLADTVQAVRGMNGICIAPHPTARGASSLSFEAIRAALKIPGVAGTLLGVEAYNGGLVYTNKNAFVAEQSARLPLAQVGNSDAHTLTVIGQGSTRFPGRTPADLRRALLAHETSVEARPGLNGVQILLDYGSQYARRLVGMV